MVAPPPLINEETPLIMDDLTTPIENKHKRVYKADICALLFGIGTWVLINGMFTQLPLLVKTAPEGWSLPSYLVILIQLANIGPIAYSVLRIGFPQYLHETCLIYVVMILGCVSMLYMALYYQETSPLVSSPHSTHLFLATFLIALVCCTSSVLFTPFMGKFPEVYLISYLLGEGLSGFLPSIIALIQGIGSPTCVNQTQANGSIILVPQSTQPLFSTQIFFEILLFLMFLSLLSFVGLNNIPSVAQLKFLRKKNDKIPAHPGSTENNYLQADYPPSSPSDKITPLRYALLLLAQALVAFFSHGVLPSLQSYSCLPYGSKAYHYTANLTNIMTTLACFLAYFSLVKRIRIIAILSSIAGVMVMYSIVTALQSPHPLLVGSVMGSVLIVANWVLCAGLISYIKLCLAAIFRAQEGKGLFWYGAVNQLGSASGALVIFLLINYTTLFSSVKEC
uniref:Riboflavin transporter n=1 Tax=Cacopsylla melanoneura TaxID=428564 RepID=A0A8D8WZM1_9HEMI